MQVSSTYRYAKISAFKAREVTRAIQGLPVSAALDLVAYQPKESSCSDQQDAEERGRQRGEQRQSTRRRTRRERSDRGRRPDDEADDDPARGSGSTIRKRSSHIRIILTDEIEIKTREKKKGGKKSGTRKSTRTKATKSTTESKTAEAPESEISNQQSEI